MEKGDDYLYLSQERFFRIVPLIYLEKSTGTMEGTSLRLAFGLFHRFQLKI